MLHFTNSEISATVSIKTYSFALRLLHQLEPKMLCPERSPQFFAFGSDPHGSVKQSSDNYKLTIRRNIITIRHGTTVGKLYSYIQRSNKISRNALGFDEERLREQFSTHIFPPNGRSS